MRRRAFAETLIDLAAAIDMAIPPLRIDQFEMTLPLEVRMRPGGGDTTLLAELPVWRWRTDFDLQPNHVRIIWTASTVP
jgi:hypothetical protein